MVNYIALYLVFAVAVLIALVALWVSMTPVYKKPKPVH
jgi:hypothetical protein